MNTVSYVGKKINSANAMESSLSSIAATADTSLRSGVYTNRDEESALRGIGMGPSFSEGDDLFRFPGLNVLA